MDPGYFEKVKKIFHFGAVQKELVDPYCTVLFAGKNGETPVIWNEQDPVWNYQINLGIRVSSTDTALFSSFPPPLILPFSLLQTMQNGRLWFIVSIILHSNINRHSFSLHSPSLSVSLHVWQN